MQNHLANFNTRTCFPLKTNNKQANKTNKLISTPANSTAALGVASPPSLGSTDNSNFRIRANFSTIELTVILPDSNYFIKKDQTDQ